MCEDCDQMKVSNVSHIFVPLAVCSFFHSCNISNYKSNLSVHILKRHCNLFVKSTFKVVKTCKKSIDICQRMDQA